MKKTFSRNSSKPRTWFTTLPTRRWLSLPAVSRFIWLLVLVLPSIDPSRGAEDGSVHAITLKLLEERKRQQISAAQKVQAFYGFQFSDRIVESNIRFVHQIVDDAGKDYKAVHYDHGNGVAVADVDGDGLPDVYFTTQLGTNQLWRNLGHGKFEDITTRAGVGLVNQIVATASFADVDNDGDPDLFVTTVRHGNHLFENLGNGRFRDITKEAGLDYVGHSSGAVFFDFDNDGLLDLFLVNVGVYTSDKQGRGGYYIVGSGSMMGTDGSAPLPATRSVRPASFRWEWTSPTSIETATTTFLWPTCSAANTCGGKCK